MTLPSINDSPDQILQNEPKQQTEYHATIVRELAVYDPGRVLTPQIRSAV